MSFSPFARHHYDQGNAAAEAGDAQEAGDHLQAIARHGSTDDVQGLMAELSEAARQHSRS